ncbi:MAG TPA: hypothetical protein VLC08_12645 [Chitinolyticbacter sp.]|nr:hypothetical protein [Chitinolyticbacter sp.]
MATPKEEQRMVDIDDPAFDPAIREPGATLDQQIEHAEHRDINTEALQHAAPLARPDPAQSLETGGVPQLPENLRYIAPAVDPEHASNRHDEERGV